MSVFARRTRSIARQKAIILACVILKGGMAAKQVHMTTHASATPANGIDVRRASMSASVRAPASWALFIARHASMPASVRHNIEFFPAKLLSMLASVLVRPQGNVPHARQLSMPASVLVCPRGTDIIAELATISTSASACCPALATVGPSRILLPGAALSRGVTKACITTTTK